MSLSTHLYRSYQIVSRAEETSTYSLSSFRTVNCRPTARNYQLFHLRSGLELNPDLRGGRRECYHSATVAHMNPFRKDINTQHLKTCQNIFRLKFFPRGIYSFYTHNQMLALQSVLDLISTWLSDGPKSEPFVHVCNNVWDLVRFHICLMGPNLDRFIKLQQWFSALCGFCVAYISLQNMPVVAYILH